MSDQRGVSVLSSGRKLGGLFESASALSAVCRGLLGPAYAGPAIASTLSITYALLTTAKLLEERSRAVGWLAMCPGILVTEQNTSLSVNLLINLLSDEFCEVLEFDLDLVLNVMDLPLERFRSSLTSSSSCAG